MDNHNGSHAILMINFECNWQLNVKKMWLRKWEKQIMIKRQTEGSHSWSIDRFDPFSWNAEENSEIVSEATGENMLKIKLFLYVFSRRWKKPIVLWMKRYIVYILRRLMNASIRLSIHAWNDIGKIDGNSNIFVSCTTTKYIYVQVIVWF